jgi:hypothetical protein
VRPIEKRLLSTSTVLLSNEGGKVSVKRDDIARLMVRAGAALALLRVS